MRPRFVNGRVGSRRAGALLEGSRRSRLAGRLITGPVAFLLAGAIDWLVLAVGYVAARARGRDPWG